jgi:hypothetical protein
MKSVNEARHRMSGKHINFKFENRSMPLIGALGRSPRLPEVVDCVSAGKSVLFFRHEAAGD